VSMCLSRRLLLRGAAAGRIFKNAILPRFATLHQESLGRQIGQHRRRRLVAAFTSTHSSEQSNPTPELGPSASKLGMDESLVSILRSIHACPTQAVFYVAGGGLQVLTWLLTIPGASNTVLEARVPYGGGKSMSEILGSEPPKFASTQTAVDMAASAYRQAAHLSAFGTSILGVSCTCALATDRIKKGDHKVCVATHDGHTTRAYSLRLTKGARDRIQEDVVASRLVIKALAVGCGLEQQVSELDLRLQPSAAEVAPSMGPTEAVQETQQSIGDPLQELLEGKLTSVEFSGGQVICNAARRNRVYLPGSFHPLHDGHKRLLAAACQMHGQPGDGCFELSVGNPDKGTLPLEEVRSRVQQFVDADLPVVVTQATLYVQKAKLFAKSRFVVGHDTAIRLVMPKYYGGSTKMLLELAALRHRGCRFLVAGRVDDKGKFLRLTDVDIPEEVADEGLFEEVPESAFREDISSTQLREQGRKGLPSP